MTEQTNEIAITEIPNQIGEKRAERDAKGRILPGARLAGAGRPKGVRPLTCLLIEAIRRVGAGGNDTVDLVLVKAMLDKAQKGDLKAIEMVWDRVEGKAPQTFTVNKGEDNTPEFIKNADIDTLVGIAERGRTGDGTQETGEPQT